MTTTKESIQDYMVDEKFSTGLQSTSNSLQ